MPLQIEEVTVSTRWREGAHEHAEEQTISV